MKFSVPALNSPSDVCAFLHPLVQIWAIWGMFSFGDYTSFLFFKIYNDVHQENGKINCSMGYHGLQWNTIQ